MAQIAQQDNLVIEVTTTAAALDSPKYTIDIINANSGAVEAIALN